MKKIFAIVAALAACAIGSATLADPLSDVHMEPGHACNASKANVLAHNRNPTRAIVATICYRRNGVDGSIQIFLAPGHTRRALACDFEDAHVCAAHYFAGHPGRNSRYH